MFAILTVQMYNLLSRNEAALVVDKPESTYGKTGKGPGRPKKVDQIAKTNTKIN